MTASSRSLGASRRPRRRAAGGGGAAARAPKRRPLALYRELRRALLGPCRVAPGATLVIACSGGPDSLALLAGLAELARRLRLRLVVAHLDHGVRAGSPADARAVARRAAALGLPCVSGRRPRGLGRARQDEAGLRRLRRAFLRRVAREHGADAIALGHTAEDQAETLLLRLTRGTGLRGLAGMRPRRGPWVRPLLGVTRAQVAEFLRDRRLRARRDPTNADLRRSRNLVRHRVLPVLARLNPRAGEALAGAAARLGAVAELLERQARRALAGASAGAAPGGIRLVRARLLRYHPAILELVIKQAWESVAPRTRGLTRKHLQAVETLLHEGVGGAAVHLPSDRRARLERGLLFLGQPRPGARPAPGKADA
jgi:tRNA(Ile)-lysidine synthase